MAKFYFKPVTVGVTIRLEDYSSLTRVRYSHVQRCILAQSQTLGFTVAPENLTHSKLEHHWRQVPEPESVNDFPGSGKKANL